MLLGLVECYCQLHAVNVIATLFKLPHSFMVSSGKLNKRFPVGFINNLTYRPLLSAIDKGMLNFGMHYRGIYSPQRLTVVQNVLAF